MAEPVTSLGSTKVPGSQVPVQKGSSVVTGSVGPGGSVWINGEGYFPSTK